MTKQELWDQLVARYPEFADEEYVLKQRSRGLRRIIDQAWDEGFAAGLKSAPKPKEDSASQMFDALFKGGKR